ncbi:MAG: 3-deoxy-manno-octulosonate cytidylyltransferase [Candidatus Methanofastidiosum methylothiophilum]|jgi:spore coat polysaccharide biosynthesis protein SpsF (cytidylyltransferase family)|uniref:3-deoxy-manno-octulosonate cytidylyltransferase n=1 Tax=Candidatus Methanofastidiosum methylothiophilum TaxID=1705564 RepID=A0A150JAC0_9EURY|nr:MAG: 3-deoxy-manno-octulosonate cytidylyltransferase [Candidatus Methanofastidiosum methylthiophilus]KYC55939.1 MAG: 3-deoxy-manno-octulosonate cytidylyltransferase [Candidatus Methanofastidiosum methylthiophilus]KYC56692.1 MAG: 3-deoxy-manno-octulosonate cytidylyltransferase [Candidatus Methanofastidiosum methylthiophilus]
MIAAIIQARMGSTRFPNKMMERVGSKPLISLVIDRVGKSTLIEKVILATTTKKDDDVLIQIAIEKNIDFFRGSENDVLDRFYNAAKKYKVDTIVRITGDCPFIDPVVIDQVIGLHLEAKSDYTSNIKPPTFPDGLDVEVFSFISLEKAWKEAKLNSEREHVTPYIWKNNKLFKIVNLFNKKDLSNIRLTIDEKEDLVLIKEIIKYINIENFTIEDIILTIENNPYMLEINNKIKRNEGYEKSLIEDKNIGDVNYV